MAQDISSENDHGGNFAGPSARPADEPDLLPNPQEGALLVRAFLSIRSPKRRQAVLEYVADQASIDKA